MHPAIGLVRAQQKRVGAAEPPHQVTVDGGREWCDVSLAEALPHIAHPQIRTRGTVGGSLAHADPAAELPAVMVALGATFELHSPRGKRLVAAEEFYTGLFTTALAPDELLVEIAIPRAGPRRGSAFAEVARRHGDYALAGVAAVVALDDAGRCREARIALLSVGDGPVLARKAAKAITGEEPTANAIQGTNHGGSDAFLYIRA